jgi:hypothetical protein
MLPGWALFWVTGDAPGCRQGDDVPVCSIAGQVCCCTRAQYSVSWLGLFFLVPSPDNIDGVKQMSSFIVCGWDIILHSRIDFLHYKVGCISGVLAFS